MFVRCASSNRLGKDPVRRIGAFILSSTFLAPSSSSISCSFGLVHKVSKKCVGQGRRAPVRELAKQICSDMSVEIIFGVVAKNHAHMLVSIPPQVSLSKLVEMGSISVFPHTHDFDRRDDC